MTKLNEKVMRNIDVMREKISKYDVFYTMCDKMILCIFDGDRKRATAYITDFEYLQRENCDSGKNILWNCYGDIILENIKAIVVGSLHRNAAMSLKGVPFASSFSI